MTTTVDGLSAGAAAVAERLSSTPRGRCALFGRGDELVRRARVMQSSEIRRIRRKLGLTQVAAARLTGGGHNAFSRYERGEVTPMRVSDQFVQASRQAPRVAEGSELTRNKAVTRSRLENSSEQNRRLRRSQPCEIWPGPSTMERSPSGYEDVDRSTTLPVT